MRKERTPSAMQEPSQLFRQWWMPTGFNRLTGAQTGGHPEAYRKCMKFNDEGYKEFRYYGVEVKEAYNILRYRLEFDRWIKDGMPERAYLYDGTAAPKERQLEVLAEIKAILHGSPILGGS